jgi:AcrR family transcriptional regulator
MELGYQGTSMAEIAARADCSKATLYGYFASKEDLFLGVIEYGVTRTVTPLLEELFASADADPEQVLRHFGENWLTLTLSQEAIAMRRLIIAQMGDPEPGGRYWDLGPQRYLDALERYLVAATKAGKLAVAMPKLAAQQLAALYEAETRNSGLFAGGRPFTPDVIKDMVEHAVKAFVAIHKT